MSARCTGQVFDRYPAGGGEFALALALADNAHDDGTHIFPSVETMAGKSRQDVRSVQRHLKRMLATGWLILVKPSVGGRGKGRAAEYRISPRWLKGEDLAEISASSAKRGEAEKGDKVTPISEHEADAQMDDKVTPISAAQNGTHAAEKGDNVSPFSDAKRVTPATQKGDKRDTPYKNRKEPSYSPLTPQGGASGFDALCAAYPTHRVNVHQARKRWAELQPVDALAELMVRAARAQARSPEWQAKNGHAVPNLSGWILNKKWRATHDERAAPAAQTAVSREGREPDPQLTPEQLQANKQRAIEARNRLRELVAKDKAAKRETSEA